MSYILESIIKKTIYAIRDYEMVSDDQGIMVGLSGGKDSSALLYVMKEFLRRSKVKFPLAAGHVGLGWDTDITPLEEYCRSLDVPFFYEPTNISTVVFDIRKEKNPCSLCAKMRRGALNSLAKANGYSKIALAHHQDDVVETILLKMFYEGRMESFQPVSYLDIMDITVIRPFIYVPEEEIKKLSRSLDLPVIKNPCPADGYTKRQDMKEILKIIEKTNPYAKERAVSALQRLGSSKSWEIRKGD